jgi:DNA-binding NarL/FixJ family response regulator
VVIVEDEAFIRLDLEQALMSAGHQVVATAVDADQAVAVVGRERPDVVLIDIRIVGPRDGIDAALEIRQRFDIACIVISAHVDPASRARMAPARPLAILSKPVDLMLLERELLRV